MTPRGLKFFIIFLLTIYLVLGIAYIKGAYSILPALSSLCVIVSIIGLILILGNIVLENKSTKYLENRIGLENYYQPTAQEIESKEKIEELLRNKMISYPQEHNLNYYTGDYRGLKAPKFLYDLEEILNTMRSYKENDAVSYLKSWHFKEKTLKELIKLKTTMHEKNISEFLHFDGNREIITVSLKSSN